MHFNLYSTPNYLGVDKSSFTMKKILFFLSLFLFSFFSCSKSEKELQDPKPDENIDPKPIVKVMTYNTYGARANNGTPSDLQALADIIKRVDPDLVALQEIDKGTRRSGVDVDQAKELAALTGMNYFFVKAIDQQGGEYGDAILSKFPIKDPKGYLLTTTIELGGEMRSVARITVDLEGKEFYFVATHLDHLSNEANRIHQAKELNDILKTFDKPVILGADLNALPNSQTMDILKLQLAIGCLKGNCQFTFPTTGANRTIDYIMYAPLNAMNVLDYSVYTYATKESDHFPVVARFELN